MEKFFHIPPVEGLHFDFCHIPSLACVLFAIASAAALIHVSHVSLLHPSCLKLFVEEPCQAENAVPGLDEATRSYLRKKFGPYKDTSYCLTYTVNACILGVVPNMEIAEGITFWCLPMVGACLPSDPKVGAFCTGYIHL